MGRIKQTYLKRIAEKLLGGEHKDEFGLEFQKNKVLVQEYCTEMGKSIRNKIAGYITKIKVQESTAVA